jgi:aminoglycoside 3-N-acetyltransferase I
VKPIEIRRLTPADVASLEALTTLLGEAFDQVEIYTGRRPGRAYLRSVLAVDTFIALVAIVDDAIVGGLVAYELKKFERACSEVYLYDLAVAESHRRRGIAERLIGSLEEVAAACGAYVIFVQAEPDDAPAVALYSKLGTREEVLHFDIPVEAEGGDG